jgi:hypothetical protein
MCLGIREDLSPASGGPGRKIPIPRRHFQGHDLLCLDLIFRLSFASETPFRQQEETSTPLTPAGLFAPAEIPWQDLAFSSTRDALQDYFRSRAAHRPGTP